jgi:hypothetical protein
MIQHTTAIWFLLIMALLVGSAVPALAQSEFVASGRDAIEFLGGYSSSSQLAGPSISAGASIKGWADLGLAAGYFTRDRLTVKAVAIYGNLLFVKQIRESAPFSLALTGSAEVEEARVTTYYGSGSATATFATAGLAAFRLFQISENIRMVPMVGARRVFAIDSPNNNLYSGGGSLQFAFDGKGRTSIIVGLAVDVVEDVSTVSISLGVLKKQRR